MVEQFHLAAIHYPRGYAIDELLLAICEELRLRGLSIGGIMQSASGPGGQCAQSVLVTDLRSMDTFNIWSPRGHGARGCRLDEDGLLQVEPVIAAAIADRVDLIIINRFGRAESLGRGLLACFASALEAGIPVLTATRAPYDTAWRRYHGGLGCELDPEPDHVLDWAMNLIRHQTAAMARHQSVTNPT